MVFSVVWLSFFAGLLFQVLGVSGDPALLENAGLQLPTPAPTPEATVFVEPSSAPTPDTLSTPAPTPLLPTGEATPPPADGQFPSPTSDVSPAPTPDQTPSPTSDVSPAPTPEFTPTPTSDTTTTPTPEPTDEVNVTLEPTPTPGTGANASFNLTATVLSLSVPEGLQESLQFELRATLLDDSGSGVPNATVFFNLPSATPAFGDLEYAQTDDQGVAAFPLLLSAGGYAVEAKFPGDKPRGLLASNAFLEFRVFPQGGGSNGTNESNGTVGNETNGTQGQNGTNASQPVQINAPASVLSGELLSVTASADSQTRFTLSIEAPSDLVLVEGSVSSACDSSCSIYAVFDTSNSSLGAHLLRATAELRGGNSSAEATVLVRLPTALSLSLNSTTPNPDEDLLAEGFLSLQDGTPLEGLPIVFAVDGSAFSNATTDLNGTALAEYLVPHDMPNGTHAMEASFLGSDSYAPSAATSLFDVNSSLNAPGNGSNGTNESFGSLLAESLPSDALVSVDGVFENRTPAFFSNLAVGLHSVRVSKQNYSDYFDPAFHVNESAYLYVVLDKEGQPNATNGTYLVFSVPSEHVRSEPLRISINASVPNTSFSIDLVLPSGFYFAGQRTPFPCEEKCSLEVRLDATQAKPRDYEIGVLLKSGDEVLLSKNASLRLQALPQLFLDVNASSFKAGESLLATARLQLSEDEPLDGMNLTFLVDKAKNGSAATDAEGRARFEFAPESNPNGVHSMQAVFPGDEFLLESSSLVLLNEESNESLMTAEIDGLRRHYGVGERIAFELVAKDRRGERVPSAGFGLMLEDPFGNQTRLEIRDDNGTKHVVFEPGSLSVPGLYKVKAVAAFVKGRPAPSAEDVIGALVTPSPTAGFSSLANQLAGETPAEAAISVSTSGLPASFDSLEEGARVEAATEREFALGLVNINTNQTVYAPGSTVHVEVGVVAYDGHRVDGANVSAIVMSPSGFNQTFSTADYAITDNWDGTYTFSYFAFEEGGYTIVAHAERFDVNETANTTFEARSDYPLDISREFSGVIFPNPQQVKFHLTARQPLQNLSFTEFLPPSFITYAPDALVVNNSRNISITWQLGPLQQGETHTIVFGYAAPEEAPKAYPLGPATARFAGGEFSETRPFSLAVDDWGFVHDFIFHFNFSADTASPYAWHPLALCANMTYNVSDQIVNLHSAADTNED
ncbi:MAG: PEGA domain-containing protein, partial [Candidatus Micrarchaeota archaeon]